MPSAREVIAPNPVPGWRAVLREQLAASGLALRREGMAILGFALLFTFMLGWLQMSDGPAEIPVDVRDGIPAVLLALLVPLALWKGEGPARRGYHQAMPVGRGGHAIARGIAGLAWTLAGVAAFFAWIGVLAASTGGAVLETEPWQWLAPFVGATAMYLLASALTLAVSHPWRWLGAGAVAIFFVPSFHQSDARDAASRFFDRLLFGQFGLSTLATGLVRSRAAPWVVPDAGRWLASAGVWLTVAVGAFLLAAYRQPEA